MPIRDENKCGGIDAVAAARKSFHGASHIVDSVSVVEYMTQVRATARVQYLSADLPTRR